MYAEHLWNRDPNMGKVDKEYTVFLYGNFTYMIENFDFKGERTYVLRMTTDTEELKKNTTIPDFVKVKRDISEEEQYFMAELAKQKRKEEIEAEAQAKTE